jgi:hypothetical protein
MADPSTCFTLRYPEHVHVSNEVLDNENIGELSMDDDGVFDSAAPRCWG